MKEKVESEIRKQEQQLKQRQLELEAERIVKIEIEKSEIEKQRKLEENRLREQKLRQLELEAEELLFETFDTPKSDQDLNKQRQLEQEADELLKDELEFFNNNHDLIDFQKELAEDLEQQTKMIEQQKELEMSALGKSKQDLELYQLINELEQPIITPEIIQQLKAVLRRVCLAILPVVKVTQQLPLTDNSIFVQVVQNARGSFTELQPFFQYDNDVKLFGHLATEILKLCVEIVQYFGTSDYSDKYKNLMQKLVAYKELTTSLNKKYSM